MLFSIGLLIIFSVDFEVALRMSASGAHFGSISANNDVSAVAAFPNLNLALCENFGKLNVLEECTVSFFVMTLDSSNETELYS